MLAESSNESNNNFMIRSIHATGSFVEKHLLDQTQLTSLHYGQKIGPQGICATIFSLVNLTFSNRDGIQHA
jgi:hypothetical protein